MCFKSTDLKYRTTLILISLFCIINVLHAQLESSKWVFGYGAGVDFSSGSPVAFEGSSIKTTEGCATVSDKKGKLLFYTDGITVWNRLNKPMPMGTGLKGHVSSTQSAIIVPLPGSNRIYYIFTIDSEAHSGGFCYSIVDMSKQWGLGDVVLRNKQLQESCNEKLTAITHANKNDIWVIVQEASSNIFNSYLLTKNGILEDPIVSPTGIKYTPSVYNTIGYMKASPNKKKIALAVNGDRLIQLFDFDNESGAISHPKTIVLPTPNLNPYGIEFSPSSQLLYITSQNNGYIYQLNTEAGDAAKVLKTLIAVGQVPPKHKLAAMQLGIDGKIYIAEYLSHYLSAIDYPDIQGKACNFDFQNLYLGEKSTSVLGLPTFYNEHVKMYNPNLREIFRPGELTTNVHYVLQNVFFDFDKAVIRPESFEELKQVANYLKSKQRLTIHISGHTDSVGTFEYNLELSLARARAIGLYFLRNGIQSSRISYEGRGCLTPLANNESNEGRQKNRRVEFILTEDEDTYMDNEKDVYN